MNKDLIEALKIAISAKDELILNLKAEIERLKSFQIIYNPPNTVPNGPVNPFDFNVPYIITSTPNIPPKNITA